MLLREHDLVIFILQFRTQAKNRLLTLKGNRLRVKTLGRLCSEKTIRREIRGSEAELRATLSYGYNETGFFSS